MAQVKYNFYKYCKATTLLVRDLSSCYPTVQEFESQFEQAKIVSNYDKWFPTMLKTVKVFEIKRTNNCGSQLFTQLPLDIMFDASISHLETIRFGQEYMNVKKKFEAEGKTIKVLNRLQQYNVGLLPHEWFSIESKHIWVCTSIDWKSWDYVRDSNSSLTTMTFQYCCSFRGIKDDDIHTMKKKEFLQIKTLRLINMFHHNEVILLNNEKMIEIYTEF